MLMGLEPLHCVVSRCSDRVSTILFKPLRYHCDRTFSVTEGHYPEKKSTKRLSFKQEFPFEFFILVDVDGWYLSASKSDASEASSLIKPAITSSAFAAR